jgi:hypothetical protein
MNSEAAWDALACLEARPDTPGRALDDDQAGRLGLPMAMAAATPVAVQMRRNNDVHPNGHDHAERDLASARLTSCRHELVRNKQLI